MRYAGALICLISGMLCIALALPQVGAETDSSNRAHAAPKKKAPIARAIQKHNPDSRKQAQRNKNDPHQQKHSSGSSASGPLPYEPRAGVVPIER